MTIRGFPLVNTTLAAAVVLLCSLSANAQTSGPRDHLTPQEAERVRENQELDKRIDVFIKAIERRFAAVNGATSASKQPPKDVDRWGELPKGTRAELLNDIAKILDEAITNIEDVSLHDEKNPLIKKALRKLAAASNGFLSQLTAMRTQVSDADERDGLERAIENTQQILEGASKLPVQSKEKKKNSRQ